MNRDLDLALRLAEAADAITMKHFRSATLAVRTKADHTPVSEVDEAVETMIREALARERPDDSIVGEEYGPSPGAARHPLPADAGRGTTRRWIIDPIDATKNYIRGIPIFATLIALENEIGVVSAPALGRRWWAARGAGAFCNGEPIRVSRVREIAGAHVAYDDVPGFERYGLGDRFLALARRCARSRSFGDFWSHMLVAEGAIEIAIEPEVALWDLAAIQVIVEEAGGRFTDLRGNATPAGGSAVSTNGIVHDDVLEAMR